MVRISLLALLALPLACAQTQPQTAISNDGHPAAGKRELLNAMARLGTSQSQDTELILKITGVTVTPKEIPGAFWRNCGFVAHFPQVQTILNGRFCYRTDEHGRYQSATRFTFNQKVLCITIEDLQSLLGNPTRWHTVAEAIHPGRSGPGYITGLTYQYSKYRFHFSISTSTYCATAVYHSSYQKPS